jgi:uncharacterized damage-inducible protein DinB
MGAEADFTADEIDRSWHGKAWSGPSLLEILADVDETSARWTPGAGVHSIFELVLHVACWERVARERALGRVATPSDAENFPMPGSSWKDALSSAEAGHRSLVEAVRALSDDGIGNTAPGCSYTLRFMLHGVAQHNLYHAGQMAILKKLVSEHAQ